MQTNLAWETLLDLPAQRAGPLHMRLAAASRPAIRDGRIPREAAQPDARRRPERLPLDRHPGLRPARHRGVPDRADRLRAWVSWTPRPGLDEAGGLPARPPEAVPERSARFDLSSARPDLRAFPRRKWVDAIRAAAETTPFDQLDYAQSGGHPRLRSVLAEHLNRSRGAPADPATISVFSGVGQSMSQVSHALLLAPHRQSALLDWARRVDGLVVEDDFDSEFSYGGPAPAVMQGTDRQRVALLGSVNRTLNPTVGIGWVVAPRRWVGAVRTERFRSARRR